MINSRGVNKNANPKTTGVEGMLNKAFFGKKSTKPQGKAFKAAKLKNEMAEKIQD